MVKSHHVLHDADGSKEQGELHDRDDDSVQAVVNARPHGEDCLQSEGHLAIHVCKAVQVASVRRSMGIADAVRTMS